MRIATWNVNSLKARLDKVTWWLARAKPDVLLMQETKLDDGEVPADVFRAAGYEVAHHGEGRWNGVGLASRVGSRSRRRSSAPRRGARGRSRRRGMRPRARPRRPASSPA